MLETMANVACARYNVQLNPSPNMGQKIVKLQELLRNAAIWFLQITFDFFRTKNATLASTLPWEKILPQFMRLALCVVLVSAFGRKTTATKALRGCL